MISSQLLVHVCRHGMFDFVEALHHLRVPMLIYSAGISDVIELVLRDQCGIDNQSDCIHILSNRMQFNSEVSRVLRCCRFKSYLAAAVEDELLSFRGIAISSTGH